MDKWICPICGPDIRRTIDEICVKCGSKVVYREAHEVEIHNIKERKEKNENNTKRL